MLMLDGVEMVGVQEASELVHRTPETVRRWVWSGRIPATKHGNKLLMSRRDLLDLVSGQRGGRRPASSLSAWAQEVRRTHVSGREGSSARDLVLGDRNQREGGSSGARR